MLVTGLLQGTVRLYGVSPDFIVNNRVRYWLAELNETLEVQINSH